MRRYAGRRNGGVSEKRVSSMLSVPEENRRQTAGEIARHTSQATGRPISRFTVARRLHGGGPFCTDALYGCTFNACPSEKAFFVVPGTPELRDNEWGRVLFTDESRFV
ncbi:hypothetical protein TNCV_1460681 [Trichonephila clavipes]|nr:hypothetical protein TNCV_1460681 [Trichonephila clavipes]